MRGGKETSRHGRARAAPETPARRAGASRRARRSRAPRSPTCRRRSPTSCGSIRRAEGVVVTDGRPSGSPAQSLGFQQGDIVLAVNNAEDRQDHATCERATSQPSRGCGASPSCAAASRSPSCSADEPDGAARSARRGPSLFAAAGLERDAPRPLADRLRPDQARRGGRPGPSARPGRRAHPHARTRARSARWCSGGRPAPARPRWRGCWPRRPTCISSRFRRSSPASPISRRCSRRRARGARPGRARCCSSTRSTASTAPSRTRFLPVMEDGTIVLVGATTENPVLRAQRARCCRARACWCSSRSTPAAIEKLLARAEAIEGKAAAARRGGARRRSSAWPTATAAPR